MEPRSGGPGRKSRSGACSGGLARKALCRLSVPQTAQATCPGAGTALEGAGVAIPSK